MPNYFMARELYLNGGRVSVLAAVVAFSSLQWLFVFSAVATLGYMVLLRE